MLSVYIEKMMSIGCCLSLCHCVLLRASISWDFSVVFIRPMLIGNDSLIRVYKRQIVISICKKKFPRNHSFLFLNIIFVACICIALLRATRVGMFNHENAFIYLIFFSRCRSRNIMTSNSPTYLLMSYERSSKLMRT